MTDNMHIHINTINPLILNAGLAIHNADWNWQGVCSPFCRMYYVTEGKACIHFKHKQVELQPDHLYIIPANTPHSYECHGLFSHFYIHFFDESDNYPDIQDFLDMPLDGLEASEYEKNMFDTICRLYPDGVLKESNPESYDNNCGFAEYVRAFKALPLHARLHIKGNLLILIARFIEAAKPKSWTSNPRILPVLRYINRNISQPLSIDTLADIACVSRQHIIRLFKQNFNQTPMQFITRKKVGYAELQLLTTEKQVKNVAYDLGFNDYSYFIRLFRKQTGHTPAAYRKRQK